MAKRSRLAALNLTPLLVDRFTAAEMVGVSATLFDRLVDDGRMPEPVRITGQEGQTRSSRVLWNVEDLRAAVDRLAERAAKPAADKPATEWKARA